ncbi:spectrin beta chain, non-erythrocytic 5 [Artibeus jamaicensis]|uniref:spectrin beta chain, non-erythrocytic 5 n=1 Tax=Artibeus jamaicensis TaxID=9417 RepID=UPI00235B27BD|nr:spectrin beta chain, non-erythrocytic 5 [Artibeus jamaicensis]
MAEVQERGWQLQRAAQGHTLPGRCCPPGPNSSLLCPPHGAWVQEKQALVSSAELAVDLAGAKWLLEQHKELGREIKELPSSPGCAAGGQQLVESGHFMFLEATECLQELERQLKALEEAWTLQRLQQGLEQPAALAKGSFHCSCFHWPPRPAAEGEGKALAPPRAWASRWLASPQHSVSDVELLLCRQQDLEKLLVGQEEEFVQLQRRAGVAITSISSWAGWPLWTGGASSSPLLVLTLPGPRIILSRCESAPTTKGSVELRQQLLPEGGQNTASTAALDLVGAPLESPREHHDRKLTPSSRPSSGAETPFAAPSKGQAESWHGALGSVAVLETGKSKIEEQTAWASAEGRPLAAAFTAAPHSPRWGRHRGARTATHSPWSSRRQPALRRTAPGSQHCSCLAGAEASALKQTLRGHQTSGLQVRTPSQGPEQDSAPRALLTSGRDGSSLVKKQDPTTKVRAQWSCSSSLFLRLIWSQLWPPHWGMGSSPLIVSLTRWGQGRQLSLPASLLTWAGPGLQQQRPAPSPPPTPETKLASCPLCWEQMTLVSGEAPADLLALRGGWEDILFLKPVLALCDQTSGITCPFRLRPIPRGPGCSPWLEGSIYPEVSMAGLLVASVPHQYHI